MNSVSFLRKCIALLLVAGFLMALETAGETLLTPIGQTSAKVVTESYYWMKEKLPATGERVERSGFFTEKDSPNDTRLFDGVADWKHSVVTSFCHNRPKHIVVFLDLKERCKISKIAFSIPDLKQSGNFPASCQLFIGDAGFESSQMQLLEKFTNPYPSLQEAPKQYDFEMRPQKECAGRCLRLVLESKSPIMIVSELKVFGQRLGQEQQPSIPTMTWRLEPEEVPGFVHVGSTSGMLGQSVQVKFQFATVRILPECAGRTVHVFARYLNHDNQDMVIACEGTRTQMPVKTAPASWRWQKIGETTKPEVHIQFQRTGKYPPQLDSILLTAHEDFDPNAQPIAQLLRLPVLSHVPGFGETLRKSSPQLPPEEFAERLAEHYGISRRGSPTFFTEDGAFLWHGKPFFPVAMYGARVDDPRLDKMPLNSFFGTLKHGRRAQEEYALIPAYHDEWYAYDMLAMKLPPTADDRQFLMHYICDEPGNVGVSIPDLQRLNAVVKRLDPNHPTFINDVPGSATNPQLMQIADCVGIDHYPVPDGRIFDIGYSIDSARVSSQGRPVVFVAQAFDWTAYKRANSRWPTPDEISTMAWLAIVHGARALWFYEFPVPGKTANACIRDVNPPVWERLLEIVRTIRAIEPELTGPETTFPGEFQSRTAPSHPVSVRLAMNVDQTGAVLIIVNAWETPAQLTLQWHEPPQAMKPLAVHGVQEKNGQLQLTPFATAVYRIEAPWIGKLRHLSSKEALAVVARRLEKGTERPVAAMSILPTVDWSKATDLLATWKSNRRPERASLCSTADGLHCQFVMRVQKNATAKITKRDGEVWRDASVELFLASQDGKYGAHLLVNLNNVQADGRFDRTGAQLYDWKANYTWQSHVVKGSETAEITITIPWKELARMTDFSPEREGIFRFNAASTSEKMDWAGLTGGSFLVPDRFGEIQIQK